MSTSANQNISKITNQHLKAAAIIKDKLGKILSLKTYVLSNSDLRTPQEIGVEENGIFFSENIYVVDIVG
jgi:hypothetical protein